jgi:RNA polymerase sigma-70 factor (ECF subfamily)
MSDVNEKMLVFNLRAGDQLAFKALYDIYSIRVFGKLLKMVKSEELAKDLLQNTFMNLWDHHATLDPELSFGAYIFKIADNLTLNAWRKASRDKALMDKLQSGARAHYYQTEEWLSDKENRLLIHQAIDQLPPQRKKVFILCRLENKSYAEVSKLLGISTSTINDHLVKATKAIKEELIRQGYITSALIFLGLSWMPAL